MEIVLRAGVQERHSGPLLAPEVMAVIVPCPPMDLRTGESYEVCIDESPPEIKYHRMDSFRTIDGPRLYTRFLDR